MEKGEDWFRVGLTMLSNPELFILPKLCGLVRKKKSQVRELLERTH